MAATQGTDLYVAYRYRANRPQPLHPSPATTTDPGSSAAAATAPSPPPGPERSLGSALDDVATSNDDFSLSVVLTNLEVEVEQAVRGAIARRLSKGLVYNGSGNVVSLGSIGAGATPGASTTCYYCLLRANDEEVEVGAAQAHPQATKAAEPAPPHGHGPPGPTTPPASTSLSVCSSDFLVCCLREEQGGVALDLFRADLDDYCRQLTAPGRLPACQTDPEAAEACRAYLGEWFEQAVAYLPRCAQFYGERLDFVLQAGLVGEVVNVTGRASSRRRDLERFVRALSVTTLTEACGGGAQPQPGQDEQAARLRRLRPAFPFVTLDLSDDASSFTCTASGTALPFCTAWAKEMQGARGDPYALKHIVQAHELRIIHDINVIKGKLCAAEGSHYALYNAFHALATCRTVPHIVLSALVHSVGDQQRPESLEVVDVLLRFVERLADRAAAPAGGEGGAGMGAEDRVAEGAKTGVLLPGLA